VLAILATGYVVVQQVAGFVEPSTTSTMHFVPYCNSLAMSEEDSAEATIVTGLLHLLEPVTVEYDQRIRAVQLAQAELADRIDVLTKQITDCVAETEFVDVSPYLQKLVNSRKKIMNVATTLNTISERLARMNRQAQNKVGDH
jgi:hypothetical protein